MAELSPPECALPVDLVAYFDLEGLAGDLFAEGGR